MSLPAALLAPFHRLDDVPARGRIAALAVGVGQYLVTDAFTVILIILLIATVCDHVVGSLVARYQRTYRPLAEHTGVVSKAAGLAILLIVRGLEAWISSFGAGSTRGMLASAMAFLLCLSEVRSLERHRKAVGAGPIPGLSRVLAWLDAVTEAKIPAPPQAVPSQPRDDGAAP